MDEKKSALFKLFLSFPSASGMSEEMAAATTAAYLETLQSFSAETITAACESYRKRSTRFPPSAGEIYERCETIEKRLPSKNPAIASLGEYASRMARINADRSPETKARVQKMIDDFKASVPKDETKAKIKRLPTEAEAQSWLERHENGAGLEPVSLSQRLIEKLFPSTEVAE